MLSCLNGCVKESETEKPNTVIDKTKKIEEDGAMLFVKNLNFKTGSVSILQY